MNEQQPSISRVVHYTSRGSADGVFVPECRAAMITELVLDEEGAPTDWVHLTVFTPQGMFIQHNTRHDEGKSGGTWHWPERVG